jgi:hypothetical protein
MKAHPVDMKAHPGDMRAHPGDMKAHPGDMKAYHGVAEAHPEAIFRYPSCSRGGSSEFHDSRGCVAKEVVIMSQPS